MAHHFEADTPEPLVKVGLLDGAFVPVLNESWREKGGLRAMAEDLELGGARAVNLGARNVARILGEIDPPNLQYLPDDRNYGLQNRSAVRNRLQRSYSSSDESFQKFWEEIEPWRFDFIERAIELTEKRRPDGGKDQGLRLAKVLDVMAQELAGKVPNEPDFGPHDLWELLEEKPDVQERAKRFFKILCIIFNNDAMSWAMEAKRNWPLDDPDFVRFSTGKSEGNAGEGPPEPTSFPLKMPRIELLRHCSFSTLRKIRDQGSKTGFFERVKAWQDNKLTALDVHDALVLYMESAIQIAGDHQPASNKVSVPL